MLRVGNWVEGLAGAFRPAPGGRGAGGARPASRTPSSLSPGTPWPTVRGSCAGSASRRCCGPVRSGASPAPAPWSWASTSPTCRWASTWGCRTRWDTSGSGPVGWDATARGVSLSWRRATPSSSTMTAWRPTGDSRWSRPGSIPPIPTSGTPTAAAWPGRRTSTAWSAPYRRPRMPGRSSCPRRSGRSPGATTTRRSSRPEIPGNPTATTSGMPPTAGRASCRFYRRGKRNS